MAIIKRAKNIRINVKNNYTCISGSFTETAESIHIEATNGNLTLVSNKKIIAQAENGIKFGTYEPKKIVAEEPGLFVSEVKWRGKKDNYVSPVYRKDMMLNHSIDLEVITRDFDEGESFELTVKQSNGRRIKGQATEFTISGSVDADGLATISNFKVECDFKEDNQDFGDIIFYHKNREVTRFKENFGWTYIKEEGITKIFVSVELDIQFIPVGYTETNIIETINSCFNRVLKNSSAGLLTGKIFFSGLYTVELPQYVPKIRIIEGKSGNGNISLGVVNAEVDSIGDNILIEMSITIIHEILHSLRLDHPFERQQTSDTYLFNEGFNRYTTALSTDPMICYNIMLYNYCIINGFFLKDLWQTRTPEYLTREQLEILFNEINLQQEGIGTQNGMTATDLPKSQDIIDLMDENGIVSEEWSAFDWYWSISIPGKRMKAYKHRETRSNPNKI